MKFIALHFFRRGLMFVVWDTRHKVRPILMIPMGCN
jgi:hypothetical protein